MAETQVENQVCGSCGAEVRPDTLFCYNCGSSVAPETIIAPKDKENFSQELSANVAEEANGDKSQKLEQAISGELADKPIPPRDAQPETKLKSAAAMRRKSRTFQPKKVEVIWEEYENSLNVWFILVAILLTLLAVGVFYLAAHLK